MRISDWSSDVCSSDLGQERGLELPVRQVVALILKLWWQDIVRQARRRDHERAAAMIVRLSDLTIPPFADRSKRRGIDAAARSEEHTSELQSLMRISYAVFCLKKKKKQVTNITSKCL